jgi:hypothetical protein
MPSRTWGMRNSTVPMRVASKAKAFYRTNFTLPFNELEGKIIGGKKISKRSFSCL